MASFRILDQAPVYLDAQGNLAVGGVLRFYQSGTNIAKNVYGDEALSINNGPEVDIGSDGRTDVDVWGDGLGAYRVRLYDAADVLVWERDDVDVQGGGTSIPALDSGEFLTNNGSVLQWATIREVPDPTGQAGKVLGTNGTALLWQALAEVDANAILTFVTGGIKISDGTNARMLQVGTGTVPAAVSSPVSSVSVIFGTAFTSVPVVIATVNGGPGVGSASGGIPTIGASSIGTASFVANLDTNAFGSTVNLTNPVPFGWYAFGTVAA